MSQHVERCGWTTQEDIYIQYHDREWGVPVYDRNTLFEFLILEGAQAGLSWITILKKRENYRDAFAGFIPEQVAKFTDAHVESLMQNAGIVRNRLKIEAAATNARALLRFEEQGQSFSDFLWSFVDGRPKVNHWPDLSHVPASTPESDRMSKALKKNGFKFVGTTICYAFMQATGMVMDHTVNCFRYQELSQV